MDWQRRRASADDAAALSLVAGASFLEAFVDLLPGDDIVVHCAEKSGTAAFLAWLKERETLITLAERTGTRAPIGYTVLTTPDLPILTDARDTELKRIYTLGLTHRTGLGPALMERALADAAALGRTRVLLGVHPGNLRARRFYERHGFAVIGERVFQVGAQRITDPIYARAL